MRITYVSTQSNNACQWWRAERPGYYLQRRGHEVQHIKLDSNGKITENIKDNIIVLNRVILNDAKEFIKYLKKLGAAKIVYELDDDMLSDSYIEYVKNCGRVTTRDLVIVSGNRQKIIDTMNLCDGVICSTYTLACLVQEKVNPNIRVFVVENYIDADWFWLRTAGKVVTHEYPTIGWAGSLRPQEEFTILGKAWKIIAEKYKETKFVIMGFQPDALYEAVPYERIIRIPWSSYEDWPMNLAEIDIGCAPLLDAPFNNCKSKIKYYEYTMAYAATVASDVLYNSTNLLLAYNTVDSWVASISYLLDNSAAMWNLIENARREVINHKSLSSNISIWVNTFEDILS